MAEVTYRSPGVFTDEIDLSGPTSALSVGIPAGVIGTAEQGPAFVPVTVANMGQFEAAFGKNADSTKFGPMAANEWLRNAASLTYLRVLGVGDGLKGNTTSGIVNRAGFVVGEELTQENGLIGNNPKANDGGDTGRTWFLVALMSQSAGSTVFSDAGLTTLGSSNAVPIVRGVLMAPSGVLPMLSGSWTSGSMPPGSDFNTPTATTVGQISSLGAAGGARGFITGSVNVSGSNSNFVLLLNGHKGDGANPRIHTCSLNPLSPNYFANILNKDPAQIQNAGHCLYTHYDILTPHAVVTGSGVVTDQSVRLDNTKSELLEDCVFLLTGAQGRNVGAAGTPDYEGFQDRYDRSVSPFVISQDGASLFRLVALDDGQIRHANSNSGSPFNDRYKISIKNIQKSTSDTDLFGKFDLVIRDFYDTDDNQSGEQQTFLGVNLNPNSDRFISRVIGDLNKFFDFDKNEAEQKLVVQGSFPNRSSRVRVELSADMIAGNIPDGALPVGFRGPRHLVTSGSTMLAKVADTGAANVFVDDGQPHYTRANISHETMELPLPMRETLILGASGSAGASVGNSLYWGVQFERKVSLGQPNKSNLPNPSIASMTAYMPNFRKDIANVMTGNNPGQANLNGSVLDCDLFNKNQFSLMNVEIVTGSNGKVDTSTALHWRYVRNGSITPDPARKSRALSVVNDFGNSAMKGFLKFSFFMQGGFNGVNIFNKDKLNMTNNAIIREMADTTNEAQENSATVRTYIKALDVMGSTSEVDIQLLAIPGIRAPVITNDAILTVENRFDAMLIMDIEERDNLNNVITSSVQQPHVLNTTNALTDRNLDTSFAAAYFPDVTIQHRQPQVGLCNAPPTVGVLGAYSLNDKLAYPWFSPAGFNRAVLTDAVDAYVKLNRANLDVLYTADINPLTTFPGRTGVVVFGQKTLQQAQSALDRVNVRRLLIDIRRSVRSIANRLLFEPNREATLTRFSSAVTPILQRVQQNQGVDRFKVIIDSTTTTQADVENNTIRGKIFVQPTRSIEFVSLDFVVTNAGAEE